MELSKKRRAAVKQDTKGRKSKGGKLLHVATNNSVATPESEDASKHLQRANVIVHLKCSMEELKAYCKEQNKMDKTKFVYSPEMPADSLPYDDHLLSFCQPFVCDKTNADSSILEPKAIYSAEKMNSDNASVCNQCQNIKQQQSIKVKDMKLRFYKNQMDPQKKSDCFWCTYAFENQPFHIPSFIHDSIIEGYGCFCCPECAVAFLFQENVNDSIKYERYHLLNYIYGNMQQYQLNIKPAPDPHFLLDKFYGTMNIQEYRLLLASSTLINVIHKPFTRILPELHEEMDPTILNIYGIDKSSVPISGTYMVRRPGDKKKSNAPTKTQIMMKSFCLKSSA